MYSLYSGLKRVGALGNEGSLVLQQLVLFSSYQNLHVPFHVIESLQLDILVDFRHYDSIHLTMWHFKL